jgi:hypothetical protein
MEWFNRGAREQGTHQGARKASAPPAEWSYRMGNETSRASLPHSLAKAVECLEGFRAPSGPFDPNGAWEHKYAVWIVLPESQFGKTTPFGALRIRREPAGADAARLEVSLAAIQGANRSSCYRAEAKMTCATDRLSTPRAWELRTAIVDRNNKPIPGTEAQETGEVAGGVIRWRRKTARTMPAPKAFTSNWALFDAIQRLPGNEAEPMTFDLFEEMDLLKPNQRLAYRRSIEMALGGKPVKLHGFDQIGEGILPYTYWLDDQRRVLMAIGGLRAFIFDPSAEIPEVSQ